MNNQCACAHCKVVLKHSDYPDGTRSDYWECDYGCGQRFEPSQKAVPAMSDKPSETPTPRTDAKILNYQIGSGPYSPARIDGVKVVSVDFARQLERELGEARQQLLLANDAAAKGETGRNLGTALEECQKELAEAIQAKERAEAACAEMREYFKNEVEDTAEFARLHPQWHTNPAYEASFELDKLFRKFLSCEAGHNYLSPEQVKELQDLREAEMLRLKLVEHILDGDGVPPDTQLRIYPLRISNRLDDGKQEIHALGQCARIQTGASLIGRNGKKRLSNGFPRSLVYLKKPYCGFGKN